MTELSRKKFLRSTGVATVAAAGGLVLSRTAVDEAAAAGPGEIDGPVHDQGGQVFNVVNAAYGAKADTVRATRGGSISAGSVTFSQSAGPSDTSSGAAVAFTTTDVGKVITVQGAGPSGGVLSATIATVVNAATVTLAVPASTTVTAAAFAFGTDDTAAIVAAISAAGTKGTVYLPAGIYTIRGATNGGQPIVHTGRGGLRGRGGKSIPSADPRRGSNTVLLCSDASAGLIANGCARYESFVCDGNNIATRPLQNGTIAGAAVTAITSHAMFIDVWATASAGTGWSIYGARSTSFYDCGTTNNAVDGLVIDGGATGLTFFHFRQHGDLRYGVHADTAVAAIGGSVQPTSAIRFVSGLLGDGDGRPAGVSTVHLRGAVDWRFPHTTVVGTNLAGPTIDLDQSQGHSVDFSHCLISSSRHSGSVAGDGTGYACIQISGTPSGTDARLFVKVDGCELLDGDMSIFVKASPGSYRYSAVGGWRDTTRFGPATAAGVPPFDTLFDGRTGGWQTTAAAAPWTGTVSYRVMAERWVELKGSVQCAAATTAPIATLPAGYRPVGATRRVPAAASSGLAVALVATSGDVSAVPVGAASFPAGATVRLDGVSFGVGGS